MFKIFEGITNCWRCGAMMSYGDQTCWKCGVDQDEED